MLSIPRPLSPLIFFCFLLWGSRTVTSNQKNAIIQAEEESVPLPDDTNTLIYLVSMAPVSLSKKYDIELAVRSLRLTAKFTGPILILTNLDEAVSRYTATLNDFENVFIQNVGADLYPKDDKGNKIKFKQNTMYYRRFKFSARKWIIANPSLKDFTYAFYLDYDIIVTSQLSNLFQEIHEKMVAWTEKRNNTSFLLMWTLCFIFVIIAEWVILITRNRKHRKKIMLRSIF